MVLETHDILSMVAVRFFGNEIEKVTIKFTLISLIKVYG